MPYVGFHTSSSKLLYVNDGCSLFFRLDERSVFNLVFWSACATPRNIHLHYCFPLFQHIWVDDNHVLPTLVPSSTYIDSQNTNHDMSCSKYLEQGNRDQYLFRFRIIHALVVKKNDIGRR